MRWDLRFVRAICWNFPPRRPRRKGPNSRRHLADRNGWMWTGWFWYLSIRHCPGIISGPCFRAGIGRINWAYPAPRTRYSMSTLKLEKQLRKHIYKYLDLSRFKFSIIGSDKTYWKWLYTCGEVHSYCIEFAFEWRCYALSASKAIFRASTYSHNTYSVRWWWLLDRWN